MQAVEVIRASSNVPSALRSRTGWSSAEIRRLSEQQLAQFMDGLPQSEWTMYMRLRSEIRGAAQLVARDYNKMINDWQASTTKDLNARLSALAGTPIDCTDTWLNTRYFTIKGPRHERIAAPGAPQERWQSLPLWTAACTNFPFNVGDGRGDAFTRSSHITFDRAALRPAPLTVSQFVGAVREVNPGERLNQAIDTLTKHASPSRIHLFALHDLRLRFDILESNRQRNTTGIGDRIRQAVLKNLDLSNDLLSWKRYRLEMNTLPLLPGDHPVQLPFFTFVLRGLDGLLSYLHGRPGGAFRFHDSEAAALAQLHKDIDLQAPWLTASLSIESRANARAIHRKVSTTPARPPGLTPVANVLYDAVQRITPEPGWRIVTDEWAQKRAAGIGVPSSWWTRLSGPIADFHLRTMKANAGNLATSNADKDSAEIIRGMKSVAGEIVDILITPVPGPLPGLGALRATAFGGLIVYGAAVGVHDAFSGEMSGLVGTGMDALDIVFGIATASMADHMASKRSAITRITMADGSPGLLLPDLRDYLAATPVMAAGLAADARGLITILGETFIAIDDGAGERHVLAVDFDTTTAAYRLRPLDARGFRPPVRYDGTRWSLDFDNLHGVGNAQLLQRMWDLPAAELTKNQAEELLRIAGVDRGMLEAIWNGGAVPQWLNELVQWHGLKIELAQVRPDSPAYAQPLSPLAETVLCQALADIRNVDINLFDATGDVRGSYSPLFPDHRRLKSVVLHRRDDGGYTTTKPTQATTNPIVGAQSLAQAMLQLTAVTTPRTGAADMATQRNNLLLTLAVYFDTYGALIEEACVAARGLGRNVDNNNRYDHIVAPVLRERTPSRETFAEQSLRAWYPGLTLQAARAVLADSVVGPIARAEPHASHIVETITDLRDTLMANSARMRAIYGPYDAASETLLLTALTQRQAWPANTAIQVVQGEFDSNGVGVITRGHQVARYGSATADHTLVLVRVPDRTYRAQTVNEQGLMVISSPEESRSVTPDATHGILYDAVLEALPAERRLPLVESKSLDVGSVVAEMTRESVLASAAVAAAQQRRSPEPEAAYRLAHHMSVDFLAGIEPTDGIYLIDGHGYIKIENRVYQIDDQASNDHSRVALASNGDSSARLYAWRGRDDDWTLRRIDSTTRRDIDAFQGPLPRFAKPSLLSIPIDGIEVSSVPGAYPYRLRTGRHHHPVYYDVDIGRWFNNRVPGKSYVRIADKWHEYSPAHPRSTPWVTYTTIPLPAIPQPPIEVSPIPRMVHFGWVGDDLPADHLLENVLASAGLVAGDLDHGWRVHLHVDLKNPALMPQLRTRLQSTGVVVIDANLAPEFNEFLRSEAGATYAAARNGAFPCYRAAMDVFKLAWILKRNGGGLYLDMDSRLIRKPVDLPAADNRLLLSEPMSNDHLALLNSVNNGVIGVHPGSEMLDALIAEAVRSSKVYDRFFERPLPGSPPDDALPYIKALAEQEMKDYVRTISHMAGPGMLNDFLDAYAPEYRQTAEASALLNGRAFRHDEFSTAVQEALDAYFPLWRYVREGSEDSWRRTTGLASGRPNS